MSLRRLSPFRQQTIRVLPYTIDLANIVIELRARLGHTIEVFGFEQRPLEALHLLRVVELPISECQRRLESVFNLPTVPVAGRVPFVLEPVIRSELADLVFDEVESEPGVLETLEAAIPDS